MFKSKYFKLDEFLRSQSASRMDIKEQYTPPDIVIDNLSILCEKILDPLREKIGPIQISSGYRCAKLNKSIGGAANSQHVYGQAADIHPVNMTHAQAFEIIKEMNLPFDQLIWEYGTKQEPNWIHISYGERNRRQILYIGV